MSATTWWIGLGCSRGAFITWSYNCGSWQKKIVHSRHYLCRWLGLDRDAPPQVIPNIGCPPQRLEGQTPGPNKLGSASGLKQSCCHWRNLLGRCWTAWKPRVNMENTASMLTIHWGSLEAHELKKSIIIKSEVSSAWTISHKVVTAHKHHHKGTTK